MGKTVAILTSGGDAPGMNAATRAMVRVGISEGLTILGARRGYEGLIHDDFVPMNLRSVSNIIQRGGTILHTARSEEFRTREGLAKAARNLEKRGVSTLIANGGDGTFHGLVDLAKLWDGDVIGVPGTIDNDLYGTDYTIGYDTAINTALEAIDRIRDTAESHDRFFLVEVMGRWAGHIALDVAIAGGAEHVVLPESDESLENIARMLENGRERGKTSGVVVVSERGEEGGVYEIARQLTKSGKRKYRITVLGHIQRGGSPTARDRILATKLGAYSAKLVAQGQSGVMAGERGDSLVAVPLEETWTRTDEKPLDPFLMDIIPALAR